jgi:hypothetical protein
MLRKDKKYAFVLENYQITAQSNTFAAQINKICCPDLRQPYLFTVDQKLSKFESKI